VDGFNSLVVLILFVNVRIQLVVVRSVVVLRRSNFQGRFIRVTFRSRHVKSVSMLVVWFNFIFVVVVVIFVS